MTGHRAVTLPSASGKRHFSVETFLEAEIRVAERRFGRGGLIFSPGDSGRAVVLFARRHGTSVQDVRRSQGGHGSTVEGG